MNVTELGERIGLDPGALGQAAEHPMEEADYRQARDAFWRDRDGFAATWAQRADPDGDALAFFLRMACEAHEAYAARGIAEDVFDGTFSDIAIWARDYHAKHGRWGIDQVPWIGQSVRLELFRLGRLQFEPIELQEPLAVRRLQSGAWQAGIVGPDGFAAWFGAAGPSGMADATASFAAADGRAAGPAAAGPDTVTRCSPADDGAGQAGGGAGPVRVVPAGSRVLNVHIAAEEPLELDACLSSFDRARGFFGDPAPIYVCDSWLLAPALARLLPADSNIVRFQRLFAIAKVHHPFRQAEERVFGCLMDDPAGYPERTRLQRALKGYLQSGREPGIGLGVIVPEMHVAEGGGRPGRHGPGAPA